MNAWIIKPTPVSQLTVRAPVFDQIGIGHYDRNSAQYSRKKTEIDVISTVLTAIQDKLGLKLDSLAGRRHFVRFCASKTSY